MLVTIYLAKVGVAAQHVNVVLGAGAPEVIALDLRYIAPTKNGAKDGDGEVAREAEFTYRPGAAPRVVSHEPRLPNGEYRLEIDVDTRDGRAAVRRQVTLGGGSSQIDVSSAVLRGRPKSAAKAEATTQPDIP
jgi:hypothetical protein